MQIPLSTSDTTIASRVNTGPAAPIDADKALEKILEFVQASTNAALVSISLFADDSANPAIPAAHLVWRGNRLDESALKSAESELLAEITSTGKYAVRQSHATQRDEPGYIVKLPLFVGERLSGHLTLAWEDKPSTDFSLDGIQLMVHTLGISLETLRLMQTQQYYIQALEYVGALSGELNILPSSKEMMIRVVNTACVLLNVRRCTVIMTRDYKVDQVHAHGLSSRFMDAFKYIELVEETRQRQQSAPIEPSRVFGERTSTPIPDAWQEMISHEGIHTCIQAPLRSHNRIFGGLWLFYDRPYNPSAYDVRLVEILATQAAVAIENIELNHANREHSQMLEERVAERTTELAIALDKAEDADRTKSQLLSTVSHELRTPLAVIKAHSSTIANYYDRLPKERHLQYLKTINDEADRLSNMINSLLDMSRLEAGTLDIRLVPFPPLEAFGQVMEALRARYTDRPLQTSVPESTRLVMADPERLRQLIANLVDNAVKYSPEKTPITISLQAWDDALEVGVKDEGYGLTPQQARRVFDRFYQTNTSDYPSSRNGVGLGLSICKGLVEEMGGRIWCTSAGLNMGSKFAFTLPWATAEQIVNTEE